MRIEIGIQALQRSIEEDARTWEMMRMRMRRMRAGGSYGQMRQGQADGGGGKFFHYDIHSSSTLCTEQTTDSRQ